MFEAERIPKRGKAPDVMGGFAFVQVGDAADYIRKALAEHVVSMMPSQVDVVGETEHPTSKGGTMTTLELRVTWTLTDGESGETATIQSFGAGADTGDKYSGKAMTNAMKYALLAGFLLSTGDDVELADSSDRRANRTEVYSASNLPPQANRSPDGGLIGIVEATDKITSDYLIRPDPEGVNHLGFRLKDGRSGMLVEASGEVAESLMVVRENLIGQRVVVWGRIEQRETGKRLQNGRPITYSACVLERLTGPNGLVIPSEPTPTQADDSELDALVAA